MTVTDSSSGNILGHAIGGYALDWRYHGDDSGNFASGMASTAMENTTILEGDVVSGLSTGSDCDDGVLADGVLEDADCDRVFTDEDCDDNVRKACQMAIVTDCCGMVGNDARLR